MWRLWTLSGAICFLSSQMLVLWTWDSTVLILYAQTHMYIYIYIYNIDICIYIYTLRGNNSQSKHPIFDKCFTNTADLSRSYFLSFCYCCCCWQRFHAGQFAACTVEASGDCVPCKLQKLAILHWVPWHVVWGPCFWQTSFAVAGHSKCFPDNLQHRRCKFGQEWFCRRRSGGTLSITFTFKWF